MPYGTRFKRTYTRGTRRPYSRTAAAKTLQRATRARLARLRSKRSTAYVARRALSLARYNNKLAYGSYQTNLQCFSVSHLSVNELKPVCFNITTPFYREPIFQYLPSGPTSYEAQQAATWTRPTLGQLTGPGTTGSGEDAWNQWGDCNDDVLNGKYKLLSQKFEFHFWVSQAAKFRIDFVAPRRITRVTAPATGTGHNQMMPDCLGSFSRIMGQNNMINPLYWKHVRKPLFLTVAPANDLSTPHSQKTVYFKHNLVVNPITNTSTTYPSAKIPVHQQVWCVISTDFSETPTTGLPQVAMKRHVSWRDGAGHAS